MFDKKQHLVFSEDASAAYAALAAHNAMHRRHLRPQVHPRVQLHSNELQ